MKWIALITTTLVTITPLAAHAQDEYQPVADKAVESIAANPFIAGAYGFIWAAVLIYVVSIARGQARANAEIADLKRKLGS